MKEFTLYKPMMKWLDVYMKDKYKNWEIIIIDSHSERLDRILSRYGIYHESAVGIDIQIDVLGIAKKKKEYKLIFIEAKATNLSIRDLGQLWAYSCLVNPDEAFLMTPKSFGGLNKILINYKREDMLSYGIGKDKKMMKVAKWDMSRNAPDLLSMIPKI